MVTCLNWDIRIRRRYAGVQVPGPRLHLRCLKEEIMFTKKELDATIKVADLKIEEILKSDQGSDLDYIRNLQTLSTLKNAAEEKGCRKV